MLPKAIAQLILVGSQIVGRAFARALREEFQAGKQAAARQGGDTRRNAVSNVKHGMSLQEAKQILHVQDDLNTESVQKRFDQLMASNAKAKGGSYYLQAKIISAKQRIDDELKDQSSGKSNRLKEGQSQSE